MSKTGKTMISDELHQCCIEILEWQSTGFLKDGVLRDIAKNSTYDLGMALHHAEEKIKCDAMKVLVSIAELYDSETMNDTLALAHDMIDSHNPSQDEYKVASALLKLSSVLKGA